MVEKYFSYWKIDERSMTGVNFGSDLIGISFESECECR